jgi:hypothetical protein
MYLYNNNTNKWTQLQYISDSSEAALGSAQGSAVALSYSGSTLAIGGFSDNSGVGAVWIYNNSDPSSSSSSWIETIKIIPTNDLIGTPNIGSSVALSYDGTILAFGGPYDNNIGAVWIYQLIGSIWTEIAKIVPTDHITDSNIQIGYSVSLSANGTILIFGGPGDNSEYGAVWVSNSSIVEDSTVWSTPVKYSATSDFNPTEPPQEGYSSIISADGLTIIFAGPYGGTYASANYGEVWIYNYDSDSGTYILNQKIVTNTRNAFGYSLALSNDKRTLMIGSPLINNYIGCASIYTYDNETSQYVANANPVFSENYIYQPREGSSVALFTNGSAYKYILAGIDDNFNSGAVWTFSTSTGSNAIEQKLILIESGFVDEGWSVALSANGNVLAFGGIQDNSSIGSAWIYTNNNAGVWTEQIKLSPATLGLPQINSDANFGNSIALSADGNTIAIGAPYYNGLQNKSPTFSGAIFVYQFINNIWTFTGTPLVPNNVDQSYNTQIGISVALSSNARFVIFGGPGDENIGAVWIYDMFTTLYFKIVPNDQIPVNSPNGNINNIGYSSSISSDGSTIAFGSTYDNNYTGAVWIYTSQNTFLKQTPYPSWAEQVKLSVSGINGFGTSCSLSADGNTIAIAGDITYVYTRNGTTWNLQQAISPYYNIESPGMNCCSLSADGNTLAFGAPYDNQGVGALWVYVRGNSNWTFQQKIVANDTIGTAAQGFSSALSANGNTLAFGGVQDNNSMGAVWVYT